MTPLNDKVSRAVKLRMNTNQELDAIVTLYPEGTIGIREKGRRANNEVLVPLSVVYQQALMHEAKQAKPKRMTRTVKRGLLSLR